MFRGYFQLGQRSADSGFRTLAATFLIAAIIMGKLHAVSLIMSPFYWIQRIYRTSMKALMFGPNLAIMFVRSLYAKIKSTVLTALTVLAILGVLLWTSIFLYGSFYYAYMPAVLHTRDVNLQFRYRKPDDYMM